MTAYHPAFAHGEHLHRSLQIIFCDTDHVDVFVAGADDLLFLDGLAHRRQTVPQAGRPLELQLAGRGAHLCFQAVHHRVGVSLEELQQLLHQTAVADRVDLSHAGSGAFLDMEEQAGLAQLGVTRELAVAAAAHRESAQQQIERLADGVGVGVGPEVAHAFLFGPPHDQRPGPFVAHGDGQVGVGLVVDQADVESGPVLLDQGELQHQRLDLVADLDPFHRRRRAHHGRGARVQGCGVLEVVGQALAQRAGLTDVDHPAGRVLELIGAGGFGDRAGRGALQHQPMVVTARRSGRGPSASAAPSNVGTDGLGDQ